MKKFVVLYTGGKDSHSALMLTLRDTPYRPVGLLIVESGDPESYMFHTYNIKWATLHAQLMGYRYFSVNVSGVKEKEVDELSRYLEKLVATEGISVIVTGAIASRYQKSRIDKIANSIGIDHYSPLWGRDPEELLLYQVEELKISFMITAVQAYGLGKEWLGKVISTSDDARELISLARKYGFSPNGEGGEFESYVVESPLLKNRLRPMGRVMWSNSGWGLYAIDRVEIL